MEREKKEERKGDGMKKRVGEKRKYRKEEREREKQKWKYRN